MLRLCSPLYHCFCLIFSNIKQMSDATSTSTFGRKNTPETLPKPHDIYTFSYVHVFIVLFRVKTRCHVIAQNFRSFTTNPVSHPPRALGLQVRSSQCEKKSFRRRKDQEANMRNGDRFCSGKHMRKKPVVLPIGEVCAARCASCVGSTL